MTDEFTPTDAEVEAADLLLADKVPMDTIARMLLAWRRLDSEPVAAAQHFIDLRGALRDA